MRYTVKLEWEQENGDLGIVELGVVDSTACESAADVGLRLGDVKPLLARLQEIVVSEQLQRLSGCSCLSYLPEAAERERLSIAADRYGVRPDHHRRSSI